MKKTKKIVLIILSAILAVCLLGVVLFFGIFPACSKDIVPDDIPDTVTTLRKTAPDDGTTPADHSALENIAYMAYVLDHQPQYHVYARNSTTSTGYEQVTQSWKDYKSAELSGKGVSVMIASDLSYSTLVKSATQTCFLGNGKAYMRTGPKPAKDSVATDIKWSTDQPVYYTREEYLKVYGEFSTELCVYVINEDTFESATEVVDNGDGTFTQTFDLKPEAACWYQYGMKTRGSLKTYPEFEKITISFTFDNKWQVLESYCEEKAKIAPSALGGIPMGSNSKTTTTFDYGAQEFDNTHYSYFPDYYNKYVDTEIINKPDSATKEHDLLNVLAGGFGKVVSEQGQQFNLGLSLGENAYDGKVYLRLPELSVDALEARLALGVKDGGKQDFYLEYKDKLLNAYYSDGFALTADIDGVLGSVNAFSEWINGIRELEQNDWEVQPQSEEEGGLDLDSLLSALAMTEDESAKTVTISLVSDDLLGLGVGVDLKMVFGYNETEDGYEYSFKDLKLDTVSLNAEKIDILVGITPDGSAEIISHKPAEAPANLTDYLDGILALIKGDTFGVNISLDGSCQSIEYINGLILNADATVKLTDYSQLTAFVPLSVKYQNLAVELSAYYTVDFQSGDYGKIYITLESINGKNYGAKISCDIKDVVSSVKALLDKFTATDVSVQSEEAESDGASVAKIVNLVLNLNFGSIIEELKADNESLKVKINADEILTALNADLGIDLGSVALTVALNGGKAEFSAEAEEFGLSLAVFGSDAVIPAINPDEYADIVEYLNGLYTLLNGAKYEVELTLDKEVYAHTTAQVEFDGTTVKVLAPVTAKYQNLEVKLDIFYTVDITGGNYGDIYLTLNELNGKQYAAKVKCNINEVITSVEQLIALFSPEAEATAYAISDTVSEIVNLDFGAIITEIIANGEEIKLGVNADELLPLFGVDLGVNFGEVTLGLKVNEGALTLNGFVPEFGLELTVNGTDNSIEVPDENEYADIVEYLNGLYTLLNGAKYEVELTLDKEVYAHTTAQVGFDGTTIEVLAPVTVRYENLEVKLDIFYTVDITGGNYGDIYLTLNELNGKQYAAKVKCNINEVITSVEQLIALFNPEAEATAYAISDTVSEIVNLDFGAIITEIIANGEEIKVAVNADELLPLFGVDLGVNFGEVTLGLKVNEGALTLNGFVPAFGLTLEVKGTDEEITDPAENEYANIVEYLNGLYTLLNGAKYEVELTLDKEVYAHTTAQVGFDGTTVKVLAPVTAKYQNLEVKLDVFYTVDITGGNYGDIYLTLNELNGKQYSAKVKCNINEVITSVEQLIALFNPEAEATAYAISDTVSEIVNLDFGAIITEIIANGEEIKVAVNADELLPLFGVDLGVNFGEVTLGLKVNDGALTLNGFVPAFGLTLEVKGTDEEITEPAENEYADIVEYLNGLYTLLNGGKYEVELTLDKEVYAHTTAQVGFDGTTVKVLAPVTVRYENLEVKLDIFYTVDITGGSYGDIYLTLNELNGKQYAAKVKCNINEVITSVEQLIALFSPEAEATAYAISDTVSDIVNLDFGAIITEIIANGEEIKVGVNADEILPLFGVDLGVNFGEVTLGLKVNEGSLTLNGAVPAFGLTLDVNGFDGELPVYDTANHLDAAELLDIVNAACVQVKDIISAQDVVFDIYLKAVVDGVEMLVDGKGEVSWVNGKIRVAVTAEMTITDIDNQKQSDAVYLNFVYDETKANSEPIVRLAINKLGIEVSVNDVTEVKDGLAGLIGTIQNLLNSGSAAAPAAAGYSLGNVEENPSLPALVDTLLDALQNITVQLMQTEEGELKDLVITYANDGKIQLGANGGVNIVLEVYGLAEMKAGVKAGNGSVINGVNAELNKPEYKFYTDEYDFVEAVYSYLFAVLEDLTVEGALGSGTFEMDIILTGDESGIAALEGITVRAKLYYTEKTEDKPKLLTAELVLDIKGTAVNVDVSYCDDYIFINLTKVGQTKLDGIAFKASTADIYDAAETIVRLVTSPQLFEVVERLTSGKVEVQTVDGLNALSAEQPVEEQSNSALTEVINKILSVDFADIITVEEFETGEHTLTIKPDELLAALGLDISVGTVFLKSDPQRHTVEASVTSGEKPWIEIYAKLAAQSEKATLDAGKYIDIGFVSTLLKDAEKIICGFEDGQIVYSLKGDIAVDIKYSVISTNITIENLLLTVGLDDNNALYANITAHLRETKYLGFTLAAARDIGITYYNNLLTLANLLSGEYKVMTFEYLLDNMFAGSSPVQWLLGTSDFVWGILSGELKKQINVSSGLTEPQTMYLYELAKVKNDGTFYLSSIINGFAVNLNGEDTVYKTGNTAATKLGLTSNYYAFDINSSGLTDGVLSRLYAAVLRDENGISGLKAFTSVSDGKSDVVNVTVNLSTTTERAVNHFNSATAGRDIDFGYSKKLEGQHKTQIFGCYSTADSSYGYSDILDEVTLNVIDLYGEVTSYNLRYGSTVYLTNLWAPEWTDESKKHTVYYTDTEGNKVGEVFNDAEGNPLGWVLTLEESLFDAENSYTIYIRKDEDGALKREIIYHTGVDGVGDVAGAFEVNEDGTVKLLNYEIDEYLLDGTFADEAKTQPLTAEQMANFTGTEVYCTYIKSTVTVNGVIYKLFTENGKQVYHVSGTDPNGILAYTSAGSVLTLENEITLNGVSYPVTAIDASAFKGVGVKNVIVPENITVIGAQAFMDNYGMESAVFLADEVTLGGSKTDGDTDRYVFYGCSISSDEKSADYNRTNLKLYYNVLKGNADWDCFRYDNGFIGIGSTTYKIGSYGGEYHGAGTWVYEEYSVNDFSASLSELTTGIKTAFTSQSYIENYAIKTLNDLTAPEGIVNKYSVSVKVEDIGGRHRKITVTVTENDNSEWKHLNELTLKSSVPYTYEGKSVDAGKDYPVTLESNTKLLVPVAEGYTFLGYAYAAANGSEELTFVPRDLTVSAAKDDVYYIVWAYDRDGVTVNAATEDGNIPATENITVTEGSLYGWYTDATFAEKVDTISDSHTVLYARLQYSLNVNLIGSNTIWGYNTSNSYAVNEVESAGRTVTETVTISQGTKIGENNCSFEYSILEGYRVEIYRYWSDGITIRIYSGETCIESILIKGFVTNGSKVSNPKKGSGRAIAYDGDHYLKFENNWSIADSVSNNSGLYYQSYDSNKNDVLFAQNNYVSGNLRFETKV